MAICAFDTLFKRNVPHIIEMIFLPEVKPTGLVEAMCRPCVRPFDSSPGGIGVTMPDQMSLTMTRMTHYDSYDLL